MTQPDHGHQLAGSDADCVAEIVMTTVLPKIDPVSSIAIIPAAAGALVVPGEVTSTRLSLRDDITVQSGECWAVY